MATTLEPFDRGDTFVYRFRLGNGWAGPMFTGGVRFTLRTRCPASTVVDDTDTVATGGSVVYAASSLGEDPEITFEDDEETEEDDVWGVIVIPDAETTTWQAGRTYWDLQTIVEGPLRRVYTPENGRGEIMIRADITRTP